MISLSKSRLLSLLVVKVVLLSFLFLDTQSGYAILPDISTNELDEGDITFVSSIYDIWADSQYLKVQDGIAYICDLYAGLHIVDVSDPTSPVQIGFYDAQGGAKGVDIYNDYAVISESDDVLWTSVE